MRAPWQSDAMVLGRLRVKTAATDAIVTRLRIDRALAEASRCPAGLPPSAILCIRSLADPLPGSLPLGPDRSRGRREWAGAFQRSIDDLAARAVRPAHGIVPPGAPAIVFLDRAELLACLARDWCDGTMALRWWWRSLFPDLEAARLALAGWEQEPQQVPAALEHLTRSGGAHTFVARLAPAAIRSLLHRLADTFGLRELTTNFLPLLDGHHVSPAAPDLLPLRFSVPQSARTTGHAIPPAPPWRSIVPEADTAQLRRDQQAFLGIGLALQRAPAFTRSIDFARCVGEWHRDAGVGSRIDPPADVATSRRDAVPEDAEAAIVPRLQPLIVANRSVPSRVAAAGEPAETDRADLRTDLVCELESNTPAMTEAGDVAHETARGSRDDPAAATVSVPARSLPTAAPIETSLGGVFYLINVGLFLELYGDFTTPAQPGITLPIWDFLSGVGEELAGLNIREDSVWPVLATLAGRSVDEAPGREFAPADDWRIPAAWLKPFSPAGVWRWSVRDARLRVEHAAGFRVLDVPLENARQPRVQLAREIDAIVGANRPRVARTSKASAERDQSRFARWLNRLMPYLRARLALALSVRRIVPVGRLLLEHHARMFVAAGQLDVVFSLADLPLSIRLAGLDRNPGWVPAAGMRVAFHYE